MSNGRLGPNRNFDGRAQRLKLRGVFPDDLIVQVGNVFRVDTDHHRVGQTFVGSEVSALKAGIVVNIETRVAKRRTPKALCRV